MIVCYNHYHLDKDNEMDTKPEWYYDEYALSGTDFHDLKEVEAYVERILSHTDFEKISADLANRIGLKPEHTLMDMGSGPGMMTIAIAPKCAKVFAVDISDMMLEYFRQQALTADIHNISFHKGGFLSYEHTGEPVDRVISQKALHHLPDFWKTEALIRVNRMLKPDGIFFLDDVVFSCLPKESRSDLDEWVQNMTSMAGEDMKYSVINHIAKEYSTYTWIMEPIIRQAGFEIVSVELPDRIFARYVCRKVMSL